MKNFLGSDFIDKAERDLKETLDQYEIDPRLNKLEIRNLSYSHLEVILKSSFSHLKVILKFS